MNHIIAHLIIKQDDKILLLKRAINNKPWGDHWHCITGKIEIGESPMEAIIREAKEEIGIDIKQPELVTTLSVNQNSILNPGTKFYSLELFFFYNLQHDEIPINAEPDKHSHIALFNIDQLPSKIIPHVRSAIENFNLNKNYDEYKSGD